MPKSLEGIKPVMLCAACRKEFVQRRPWQKYCSRQCQAGSWFAVNQRDPHEQRNTVDEETLSKCYALRRLIAPGRIWLLGMQVVEFISYPFPGRRGAIHVMMRLRAGDPSSMIEWKVPEALVAVMAPGQMNEAGDTPSEASIAVGEGPAPDLQYQPEILEAI